jgi:hypothetical protein
MGGLAGADPPVSGERPPAGADHAEAGHIAMILGSHGTPRESPMQNSTADLPIIGEGLLGEIPWGTGGGPRVAVERPFIADGRAVQDRLTMSGSSEADARALASLDRISGPPRIHRTDALQETAVAVGLGDSVSGLVRVFNEAELHGLDPAGAADRDSLIQILRRHEETDPHLWRGSRLAGDLWTVADLDAVDNAGIRTLGRIAEIIREPGSDHESVRRFSAELGLDDHLAVLTRLFDDAQAHDRRAFSAVGRDELRSILDDHRSHDPALWDGLLTADRQRLRGCDEATARALSRMNTILGSESRRPLDDPLMQLAADLGMVRTGSSTGILARLFNDAQAHGHHPADALGRDGLVRVLNAHRDSDPRLWDGLLVADRLRVHGADDATARTLARLHEVIEGTPARGSHLNADSLSDVAYELGLDSAERLARLFDDAQAHGFDPAGAPGRAALVEALDTFSATDPSWTGERVAARYGIRRPDDGTTTALGRIIEIVGRSSSPYFVMDPVVRLTDELHLTTVEQTVRLFEGAQAHGFDPGAATDRATLADALRRYRDQEPQRPPEPGHPPQGGEPPAHQSTTEAVRDRAAAEVALARRALQGADQPRETGMAQERLDSLIARVHALDRWPSRPEVSYVADYDAFRQHHADAIIRAERGEPMIPYLSRTATDGLGSREHGRPFGLELEFDGPREITRLIAQDLYDAGLSADPHVHEYHASLQAGYKEAANAWKMEVDESVTGELVSPILYDEPATWNALTTACEIIRQNGGKASLRTGGHIHVGVHDFDHIVGNHKLVLDLVDSYADTLFRLGQNPAHSRHRGVASCAPNLRFSGSYTTVGKLRALHTSHIFAVNLGSVEGNRADHIEFRFPDGSLDPPVIQTQVKIMLGITEAALRNGGERHSPGPADDLGIHARQRDLALYPGGHPGPGPKETESFRRLMDQIFHRAIDKAQATALFAATQWSRD